MKVLFATPPLSLDERYGSFAGAGSSAPSLGILMLAAVTRKNGYESFVIDAAALNLARNVFLGKVMEIRPDVLGFSATTLSVLHADALAREIRRLMPATRIILGGPHPSAVPVETCERFPVFDAAVVGEGEETIIDLLDALNGSKSLNDVPGIVFRQGEHIIVNSRRPFIGELDSLPFPAWDLLEGFPQSYAPAAFKTRKLPAVSLVTSRGCPNRCIFCDRSVFGSSCHAFSAEYVVEMIQALYHSYGVREFCFEDDTFVTFRSRLAEICHRFIELKLDISWSCLGRVNHVNEENLTLMKRAGCWQISYGIESGSQDILNLINKNITLDQIRKALYLSRKAGLLNKGFFIVGHPGETAESLRQTIELALELHLDDISVMMLTPFPGSEIYARAAEFGAFDPDWSRMNMLNAVFVPHGLTEDDLQQTRKELLRRFYFRSGVVSNYALRALRNPAMTGALWKGFRSFLRSI